MTRPSCLYEAVLFDLDGTLLDTAPDFAVVLNQLPNANDLPPMAYPDIRALVSNGSKALVEQGLHIEESHPSFAEQRQALLDGYLNHLAVKTTLFPSLDELLLQLEQQHIPWGIVTNKPVLYAAPLLEQLALAQRCSTLVCPDHVTQRKPDPESLFLACKTLKAAPQKSVYVGDHPRDIQAGINAGMTTITAAYGYLDPTDQPASWGADALAEQPEALHSLIFS